MSHQMTDHNPWFKGDIDNRFVLGYLAKTDHHKADRDRALARC